LLKIDQKKIRDIQQIAMDATLLGEHIISLIELYKNNKTDEKLAELQSEFKKIESLTKAFSSGIYSLNEYVTKLLFFLLIFLVVFLGGVATFISTKISNSISIPIELLVTNLKQIAKGNLKASVIIDSKNEIGELSTAFSKIQMNLQDIISYSKKVAKGDYSTVLIPNSKDDELSFALNEMAVKLNGAKIKDDKEIWLQKGINGLNDQMRGDFTVREVSERIICYLKM